MSMRDYDIKDYGLVLSEDHLQILASRISEDYSDEEWETDKWDFIGDLKSKFDIQEISEFSGEAFGITDAGESDWSNTDMYSGDPIYYIPTSKYPSLSIFKPAYRDIDELIGEFKWKIGRYLPDDFDYRSNIRHIRGW